ncbi:MAG: hypothetical protein L0332_22815 [Chloroflexi bacterium]|nr:hypothetical protein [Chloroflexota bacterium]MCI0577068.1 hypothetical protein [Chloroflexota bacterium]MCI0650166.1 hypothetical protein [Chloroflexota bacterium]MCI0729523.1 hypothetical protein [Chloroflexota bacterium]
MKARVLWLLFLVLIPATAVAGQQANSGRVPLTDTGPGDSYLGFEGGLYPGGSNVMPEVHSAAGLERANRVQPLDVNGNHDPNGKIVLMSVGMSNTAIEFCSHQQDGVSCNQGTFMDLAAGEPAVNHDSLVIVNGARGGQDAIEWVAPEAANYNWIRNRVLQPLGLSESQVQVVWLKEANSRAGRNPSLFWLRWDSSLAGRRAKSGPFIVGLFYYVALYTTVVYR